MIFAPFWVPFVNGGATSASGTCTRSRSRWRSSRSAWSCCRRLRWGRCSRGPSGRSRRCAGPAEAPAPEARRPTAAVAAPAGRRPARPPPRAGAARGRRTRSCWRAGVIWAVTSRWLFLADLGRASTRARARDPRLVRGGRRAAGMLRTQFRGSRGAQRDRRRGGRRLAVTSSRSGRSPGTATSGRSGRCSSCRDRASRADARHAARLAAPRPRWPSGSRRSRRRAPAPSTSRRPSCAGSSGTCTTAPRRGWSRSAMSLGMAEQRLADDPERARRAARRGARRRRAGAARAPRPRSRDPSAGARRPRARGGAGGARRTQRRCRSTLSVDVAERPAPAVESAAYFVAAEALANAGKHARRRRRRRSG